MKIRSLFLASTLVLTAAGAALAQSNPPANNPTAQAGSKADDSSMSKPAAANDKMKSHATTGSGVTTRDTSEKDVSPASPAAGTKQEK
jgi:hypothetical protein